MKMNGKDACVDGSAVVRIDRSASHVRVHPPMSQCSSNLISSSTITITTIQNLYLGLRAMGQVYTLVDAEIPSIYLCATQNADG